MSKFFKFAVVLMMLAFSLQLSAHESKNNGCIKAILGDPVCAPPGGEIHKDILGNPVCGYGQCLKSITGDIYCSKQMSGYATLNRLNQITCTGGCVAATSQICEKPR